MKIINLIAGVKEPKPEIAKTQKIKGDYLYKFQQHIEKIEGNAIGINNGSIIFYNITDHRNNQSDNGPFSCIYYYDNNSSRISNLPPNVDLLKIVENTIILTEPQVQNFLCCLGEREICDFWDWARNKPDGATLNNLAQLLGGSEPVLALLHQFATIEEAAPFWDWARARNEGSSNLATLIGDNDQVLDLLESLRAKKDANPFWNWARGEDSSNLASLLDDSDKAHSLLALCIAEGKGASPGPRSIPTQKIRFGPPGTGKSHGLAKDQGKPVRVQFHPDYSYGDFFGKLVPQTKEYEGRHVIDYTVMLGPFLEALVEAYRQLLNGENKSTTLLIEEINRGNGAAIFGEAFQLLDRCVEDEVEEGGLHGVEGWSSYGVKLPPLLARQFFKELAKGVAEMIAPPDWTNLASSDPETRKALGAFESQVARKQEAAFKARSWRSYLDLYWLRNFILKGEIALPPNLSLGATMNTADESIYPMDSAFKRRWTWEYVGIEKKKNLGLPEEEIKTRFPDRAEELLRLKARLEFTKLVGLNGRDDLAWTSVIEAINEFITKNPAGIRGLDDKQIGHWYMKGKKNAEGNHYEIQWRDLKPKLLHFFWDSVFSRNRGPLEDLLFPKKEDKDSKSAQPQGITKESLMPTFGAFLEKGDDFMKTLLEKHSKQEPKTELTQSDS
jgi:hypothetical protein